MLKLNLNPKFFEKAGLGAIVFFFVMLFFVSMQGFAQSTESKVKFGIKGGVNFTNFYSGDNITDEKVKTGFHAGMYIQAPLVEDVLFLQPEILYSKKGNQSNYNNFIQGSGKYQFSLGYLEVPVALGLKLGPFSLHAGPYAAFLTDAKVKDVDSNGTIEGATTLNKQNFNSFDYGLIGGAGFDFNHAQIGLRYNMGLREIGNSGLAGELTKNAKNSALQIYAGFSF
jgi:hypothetical protein